MASVESKQQAVIWTVHEALAIQQFKFDIAKEIKCLESQVSVDTSWPVIEAHHYLGDYCLKKKRTGGYHIELMDKLTSISSKDTSTEQNQQGHALIDAVLVYSQDGTRIETQQVKMHFLITRRPTTFARPVLHSFGDSSRSHD